MTKKKKKKDRRRTQTLKPLFFQSGYVYCVVRHHLSVSLSDRFARAWRSEALRTWAKADQHSKHCIARNFGGSRPSATRGCHLIHLIDHLIVFRESKFFLLLFCDFYVIFTSRKWKVCCYYHLSLELCEEMILYREHSLERNVTSTVEPTTPCVYERRLYFFIVPKKGYEMASSVAGKTAQGAAAEFSYHTFERVFFVQICAIRTSKVITYSFNMSYYPPPAVVLPNPPQAYV